MDNNQDHYSVSNRIRIVYCDYLRVFATFAVMIIHISAYVRDNMSIDTFDWHVANVYGSISRWAVPVFVMISGALFLRVSIPLRRIYCKNIARMLLAFFFWGTVYAVFEGGSIETVCMNAIQGAYHMWFVPMIIGIYMCLPIIQKIVESPKVVLYYLVLTFFCTFLCPQIMQLVNDFGQGTVLNISSAIKNFCSNMNLYMVMGYVGYFIGGYYLSIVDINKFSRCVIYSLGILGFLATIALDAVLSANLNYPTSNYQNAFSINVLFESITVFVWFRYHSFRMNRLNKMMIKFAKYSFGAYLLHVAIIGRLDIPALASHSIVYIPIVGVITFGVSYILSAVLNQIPIFNRFFV